MKSRSLLIVLASFVVITMVALIVKRGTRGNLANMDSASAQSDIASSGTVNGRDSSAAISGQLPINASRSSSQAPIEQLQFIEKRNNK